MYEEAGSRAREVATTVADGQDLFSWIGGFTFWRGQAMIQLIRAEVVEKYHWLEDEEFRPLLQCRSRCQVSWR